MTQSEPVKIHADLPPLPGWVKLMLFSLVFCLIVKPQLGTFPISPMAMVTLGSLVMFPKLYQIYKVLALDRKWDILFNATLTLMIGMGLIGMACEWLPFTASGIRANWIMLAAMLLFAGYSRLGDGNFLDEMYRYTIILMIMSVCYFLLCVWQPSIMLRLSFFLPPQYSSDNVLIASGLAGAPHIFPYHAVMVVAYCMITFQWRFNLAGLLRIGMMGLAIYSLFLQGGRSGALGLGMTLLGFLLFKRKNLGNIFLIIFSLCLVWWIGNMIVTSTDELELSRGTLFERIDDLSLQREQQLRLDMQENSFVIIANNPFGLPLAGKQWGDEILQLMPELAWLSKIYFVHNFFLGIFLNYGWLPGIVAVWLTVAGIWGFCRLCWKNSNLPANLLVSGIVVVAELPNLMTHNAGYFNEVSVFMLWILMLLYCGSQTKSGPQTQK